MRVDALHVTTKMNEGILEDEKDKKKKRKCVEEQHVFLYQNGGEDPSPQI